MLLCIGVSEKIWVHGCCLDGFFHFISSHPSLRDDPAITIQQKEDKGVFKLSMSSFINVFVHSNTEVTLERKRMPSLFSSFLESFLPSPNCYLRLITESRCFHCRKYGGFMIKCSSPGCSYMLHPLCYRENNIGNTMCNLIDTNSIVCILHRKKAETKKEKPVQHPRFLQELKKLEEERKKKPVKPWSALKTHDANPPKKERVKNVALQEFIDSLPVIRKHFRLITN